MYNEGIIVLNMEEWKNLRDWKVRYEELEKCNLNLRDALLNEEVMREQHEETIIELRAKIAVLKELLKEIANG